MKKISVFLILAFVLYPLFAQNHQKNVTVDELLKLYADLRVADVSDGMDMAGLPDVGLMNQRIEPLWKDIENFRHRICGIAVTARYVPTNSRSCAVGCACTPREPR
jgi:regulator of RNase E activity RraA